MEDFKEEVKRRMQNISGGGGGGDIDLEGVNKLIETHPMITQLNEMIIKIDNKPVEYKTELRKIEDDELSEENDKMTGNEIKQNIFNLKRNTILGGDSGNVKAELMEQINKLKLDLKRATEKNQTSIIEIIKSIGEGDGGPSIKESLRGLQTKALQTSDRVDKIIMRLESLTTELLARMQKNLDGK